MASTRACVALGLFLALPILSACSDVSSQGGEEVGSTRAALQGPNGISADLVIDSHWAQGYCARVVVRNQHPTATTGTWSVGMNLGPGTTFTTWDATFSGNTGNVTVTPVPHNTAIAPGGTAQFGVCATIPTPGIQPTLTSVNSDLPPTAVTTEYKLAATQDNLVSPSFMTELWASFYRPATLTAGQRYPLLVLMHGNHPTCGTGTNPRRDDNNQYATTGTCPANYVVAPSHRGYDYIATDLAARGYLVISINTNRGINGASGTTTDASVIGPRGRLLLRHLERLRRWDAGTEATPASLGINLTGRIDFTNVGLFGHSRGGEGVLFAYNEYRRSGSPWPALIGAPVTFRGIFAIGPTDDIVEGQFPNPGEVPWNVLLPACDWDLPQLPGVKPFDRMLRTTETATLAKSFYHVWGTNHNFFNSEWQQADANIGGVRDCIDHTPLFDPNGIGSAAQRETGRFAAVQFFTAHVGPNRTPTNSQLFDTAFALPVTYKVNRGWHPGGGTAQSLMLEDFLGNSGTSSYNLPNQTSGTINVVHFNSSNHDATHKLALIEGFTPSPSTWFQTNFSASGTGFNLSSYQFLDFRVDRSFTSDPAPVAFLVQLVNSNNSLSSSVSTSGFIQLVPPPRGGNTLQTVRIPLTAFSGATLTSVRAVRLTFNTAFPGGGGIFLANVRATRATTPTGPTTLALETAPPPNAPRTSADAVVRRELPSAGDVIGRSELDFGTAPAPEAGRIVAGNVIESVKSRGADVEITLSTERYFDLRGSALRLSAGNEFSTRAEHPNGDLHKVKFLVPREAFDRLVVRAPLSVDYGAGSAVVWEFGELNKGLLDR